METHTHTHTHTEDDYYNPLPMVELIIHVFILEHLISLPKVGCLINPSIGREGYGSLTVCLCVSYII